MTPEQKARQQIDQLLQFAGWDVQNREIGGGGMSFGVVWDEFWGDWKTAVVGRLV